MVLTASEGQRKIDVPILVIVTVGRAPIIVYETGVTGENFCLRMLFPQSAHVVVRWAQKPGVHLLAGR